jgi:hypothetical protein
VDMKKSSLVVASGTVKHVLDAHQSAGVENVWKKRGSLVEVPTVELFFV